jgi:hypothetical protein
MSIEDEEYYQLDNLHYCDFSPESKIHIMATVRAKGRHLAIEHLLDFGFTLKVSEALVNFCIRRMNK